MLAAFLIVMQAAPPVPRQAIDNHADKPSQKPARSDSEQKNATPSIPDSALTSQSPSQSPAAPHGNTETSHANQEGSKPSSAWTRSEWLAAVYDVLTGALVIVGIFGVLAAIRTLRAIEGQVTEMKTQRGVMDGQLIAMKGQLEQMKSAGTQTDSLIQETALSAAAAKIAGDMAQRNVELQIDKERPRIIKVVPQKFDLSAGSIFKFISYQIHCICPTPAFISDAQVGACLEPSGSLPSIHRNTFRVESFEIVEKSCSIKRQVFLDQAVDEETFLKFDSGALTLFFYGNITWRGVHLTDNDLAYGFRFCWRWSDERSGEIPGLDFSHWVDESQSEPQNPN